jgi:cation:H+ antiporter
MIWLTFLGTVVVLVAAATQLARYGDAIGVRTRLGGLLIGSLLLAGATSLPEILTAINSVSAGAASLSAGDLLGSSMVNMLLLAVVDLVFWRQRILRQVALRHGLTASVSILLNCLVIVFIMAKIDLSIGWIGLDSIVIVAAYVGGTWLLRLNSGVTDAAFEEPPDLTGVPSLRHAIIGFAVAAAVLAISNPLLVQSATAIADATGVGTGFIGAALVAFATSLPELVTTIAAIRIGAHDMAVGNLFGSNAFNMTAFGLADFLYPGGHFLMEVDAQFALIGAIALFMMSVGLVGNLSRVMPRRRFLMEMDGGLLLVSYFLGMYLLYARNIGG